MPRTSPPILPAHTPPQAELEQLREDLAPSWFSEPLSAEGTAERYIRPALRSVFLNLVREPVGRYLDRHAFQSDLLKAMYATTDAFSGLTAGLETAGAGANFLLHNMCRLPGSGGSWMVVAGGMGTVTRELLRAAEAAGARVHTGRGVRRVETGGAGVTGVLLADGEFRPARAVVCNADPFRTQTLVGKDAFPPAFNARLDAMRRPGHTMKVKRVWGIEGGVVDHCALLTPSILSDHR